MLDVIGAGATAHSDIDWHAVWKQCGGAEDTVREIQTMVIEGKRRTAVQTKQHSEFSTSWFYQVSQLFIREMQRHWRDPTYMISKFGLNIVGGLFVGFTFFKVKGTIQGTQDKIFVC
jgi:ATP-binding cassette, subfamily G (WHITE), member 2, SNQ2